MKAVVAGLGVLLTGCASGWIAQAPDTVKDCEYYELAKRTPQTEQIEGSVRYVEAYRDNDRSLTRFWILADGRAYVAQCQQFESVSSKELDDPVSVAAKVIGHEKGLRIYDGSSLCHQTL